MTESHSEVRIQPTQVTFNLRINLPEREADRLRLM